MCSGSRLEQALAINPEMASMGGKMTLDITLGRENSIAPRQHDTAVTMLLLLSQHDTAVTMLLLLADHRVNN